MKRYFYITVCCVMSFFLFSFVSSAEESGQKILNAPAMTEETPKLDKKGGTVFRWYSNIFLQNEDELEVGYEVEVSKSPQFSDAQKFTLKEQSLTVPRSVLGANGGRVYVRVRGFKKYKNGSNALSEWSTPKEYVFVAINKKNFPGMYKLLRAGGKHSTMDGVKRVKYDKNGDKWLDPNEIQQLLTLSSKNDWKKKKGKYYVVKSPKVTSFKGVEYLTNLQSITLDYYGCQKLDLSKTKVKYIDIRGLKATKIKVNAPKAKDIHIEADDSAKLRMMDLSQCGNAIDISAYGCDRMKKLKLPKQKNMLKVLSVSQIMMSKLDLNKYKALQQVYVYQSNFRKVCVKRCSKLRYIYFYFCRKMKNLDLSKNRRLVGMDFYQSPGLTKKTVKRPKKAKCTWGKGKWWYGTKTFQKDMEKIHSTLVE